MLLSHFIRQKSYEHIEGRVRRSPLTLAAPLGLSLLLLGVPIGVYFLLAKLLPDLLSRPVLYPLLILLGSIYLLSVNLFCFSYFIDWYLDLLVITNDRLIHIEQRGLFARSVFEVDLYQIQNATSTIAGVTPTLFRYGNVYIETAGATPKLIANQVPRPHELRQQIMELAAIDKRYHLHGNAVGAGG